MTWVLLIALWSGNTKEYHYFGTYTSQAQCDAMATRIKAVAGENVSRRWICVEVPK